MNFSTLTRCPNTYLFKDERPMLLCVDCLSHPKAFSTTFDSKSSCLVCDLAKAVIKRLETSTFAATIMNVAYGIDIQESDDPYLLIAEECLDGLNKAAILGTFWVDFFPILKYVPSWVPGAGFQKQATHWRELNASMTGKPFRFVKEQLVGDHFFELINLSK
jgi:hypothetical protein